jgi:cytochrome c oxidase subunit 3
VSFLQQLTDRPWLAGQRRLDDRHEGSAFSLPAATLGLRVFLAVFTVLFTLLVAAYAERMSAVDWRPLAEPWLLWPNTVLLILSSAAFQWAAVNARRGQLDGVKNGLIGAGVFAVGFFAGQILAWQQLIALGYFAATNPANGFFYMITMLHGLHLLGGLVVWARITNKVWRGGSELSQLRLSVQLCAVYWHFLLVVWLVLFALLLFT